MEVYTVNVGGFIYFARASSYEKAEQKVYKMLGDPNMKPSDLTDIMSETED